MNDFCPFIKTTCRDDCTFFLRESTPYGVTTCKLRSALDNMPDELVDKLSEISFKLDSIT